jgi:peroxiredoxin family protein
MQVSIFFTFWGLFSLVRPEIRVTGKNWMQKMLAVMNRPGIGHLKLSKLNFVGMGPWMMHRLAKQHGVAKPGELLEMAQALGVRLIPCQMSMDLLGVSADQLIDGVEPAVGAATALELMAEADATLFI